VEINLQACRVAYQNGLSAKVLMMNKIDEAHEGRLKALDGKGEKNRSNARFGGKNDF
jgi:hypothetical protein